ncbi:hypothetical protein FE810_11080 [Thalassotalea litorea]|uniref:Lipoprotein n=1 Tax=Thalassotalea litorea TaxID=2020715 RepID=A0A5R9IGH7_9GAMM|nr:hypothetical protein [Thalassotalea litorea]TLU64625.1 hypothetical protein FE810_11080 [Thalassotalea litorea]
MLRKVVLCCSVIIAGCASVPNVNQYSGDDGSVLKVTRFLNEPILGSRTSIYSSDAQMQCISFDAKKVSKFMNVGAFNPLISDFNLEGVKLEPGKEVFLQMDTRAGMSSCPLVVSLIPEDNVNYEIRITGNILASPHQCVAKLYSIPKDTNLLKPDNFSYYNDCKSRN